MNQPSAMAFLPNLTIKPAININKQTIFKPMMLGIFLILTMSTLGIIFHINSIVLMLTLIIYPVTIMCITQHQHTEKINKKPMISQSTCTEPSTPITIQKPLTKDISLQTDIPCTVDTTKEHIHSINQSIRELQQQHEKLHKHYQLLETHLLAIQETLGKPQKPFDHGPNTSTSRVFNTQCMQTINFVNVSTIQRTASHLMPTLSPSECCEKPSPRLDMSQEKIILLQPEQHEKLHIEDINDDHEGHNGSCNQISVISINNHAVEKQPVNVSSVKSSFFNIADDTPADDPEETSEELQKRVLETVNQYCKLLQSGAIS